jgi:hypothetical protein
MRTHVCLVALLAALAAAHSTAPSAASDSVPDCADAVPAADAAPDRGRVFIYGGRDFAPLNAAAHEYAHARASDRRISVLQAFFATGRAIDHMLYNFKASDVFFAVLTAAWGLVTLNRLS